MKGECQKSTKVGKNKEDKDMEKRQIVSLSVLIKRCRMSGADGDLLINSLAQRGGGRYGLYNIWRGGAEKIEK